MLYDIDFRPSTKSSKYVLQLLQYQRNPLFIPKVTRLHLEQYLLFHLSKLLSNCFFEVSFFIDLQFNDNGASIMFSVCMRLHFLHS